MAVSLSQMLIRDAGKPQQSSLASDVSKGVTAGIQLATASNQIEAQKTKQAADRIKLEQGRVAFARKGIGIINSATSPAAAKRKGKIFQDRARAAGIPFSDDFIADMVENQSDTGKILAAMGRLSDPEIPQENRSAITSQFFELAAEGDYPQVLNAAKFMLDQKGARKNDLLIGQVGRRLNLEFGKRINKLREGQSSIRNAAKLSAELKTLIAQGKPVGTVLAALSRSVALAFNKGPLSREDVQSFLSQFGIAGSVEGLISFIKSAPPRALSEQLDTIIGLTAEEFDKNLIGIQSQMSLAVETPEFSPADRAGILQAAGLRQLFPKTLEGLVLIPPTEKREPPAPGELKPTAPRPGVSQVEEFIKAQKLTGAKATNFRRLVEEEKTRLRGGQDLPGAIPSVPIEQ